eukprot:1034504-Prorocentrum_minimum.AAC.1
MGTRVGLRVNPGVRRFPGMGTRPIQRPPSGERVCPDWRPPREVRVRLGVRPRPGGRAGEGDPHLPRVCPGVRPGVCPCVPGFSPRVCPGARPRLPSPRGGRAGAGASGLAYHTADAAAHPRRFDL